MSPPVHEAARSSKSMFAGLMSLTTQRACETLLPEATRERLRDSPAAVVHHGRGLWMGAGVLQPEFAEVQTRCHVDAATGVLVAFWGHLYNRAELIRRWRGGADDTDAALLGRGWAEAGTACVEALEGVFALAVVDDRTHRAMLARDPLGVKPICYATDDGTLRVASSLSLLRRLMPARPMPDPEWIVRYLVRASAHDQRTAFPGMTRLPPGSRLVLEGSAAPRIERWFEWRNDPAAALVRDERWVLAYRDELERAVERCRAGVPEVACENSGGIDSAALMAILARQVPQAETRVVTLGLATHEEEDKSILGLSRHLGLRQNHVMTRQAIDAEDADILRSLRAIGHPEENGIAVGMAPLHEVCRRTGLRDLFSGFGGDEAVSAQAQLPLRRELLDQRCHRALYDVMPGSPPARVLRVLRARWTGLPPLQQGLLTRGAGQYGAMRALALLRDDATRPLGLAEEMNERWRRRDGERSVNASVLRAYLGSHHVSSRLEGCTLFAASRGLEYHWPLLDVRLIQQYLDTPAIEKAGPGGVGRFLHRRAIAPWMPADIAWRPTKDMGMVDTMIGGTIADQPACAAQAHALLDGLHPALQAIVDTEALRSRAARASRSELDFPDGMSLKQFVRALRWTAAWLAALEDGSLERWA